MNHTSRVVSSFVIVGAVVATGALAGAQRRGARNPTPAAPVEQPRVIAIPCIEACNMMQRMRVWMFTPPAASTAFGIGDSGEGQRVWVLLPSCRQPNPDDPTDPCPVGRVTMEVITGSGSISVGEPRNLDAPSVQASRRVQAIVVPPGVQQVRIKILRHDDTVRYEAAVDAAQLHNLPAPEGSPQGATGFNFELASYPSR